MLKRLVTVFAVILVLTFALGCGSTLYDIQTTTGKTYTTKDEPKFDDDSMSYKFKDLEGNKVIINKDEVQEIKSRPGN